MSLTYLDSLATEASGDTSLQRELAGAYSAVANIQGRSGTENLGDTNGALASYQKSAQIVQALWANSHSDQDQHDLAALYVRIGHTLSATGDSLSAMNYDHMALDIFTKLTQKDPANLHYQTMLSIVYLNLGEHEDFTGDFQQSLENYEKAAAIYQQHIKSDQQRVAHVALYNLGHTYDLMQYAWQDLGNYSRAVECGEKALEIRKKIMAGNPKNVRGRLDLADTYFALGETLRKEGLAARAAADYRQSQAIAESEAASDTNDQRAKETLAFADYGLGESLLRQGNLSQAIDLGQRAVKIASALVAADPLNAQSKTQLAVSYGLLGDAHQARGLGTRRGRQAQASELKEAVSLYQKGLEIFASLRQSGNLSYSQIPELSRVPREIAKCNVVMRKAQSPVASEIK